MAKRNSIYYAVCHGHCSRKGLQQINIVLELQKFDPAQPHFMLGTDRGLRWVVFQVSLVVYCPNRYYLIDWQSHRGKSVGEVDSLIAARPGARQCRQCDSATRFRNRREVQNAREVSAQRWKGNV